MRLLLTSNGFPKESVNIRREFFRLARKLADDIRVAYVPTASHVEEDKSYADIDRGELLDMGIPKENVLDFELDHQVDPQELEQFDAVFIEGGNTFYLLEKVRESGFDKAIKEYLDCDRGIYVGVSAGTVLAGPNVEIAGPWDDKNLAKLENTIGLNLVPTAYCPHFQRKEEPIIEELRKQASYLIEPLEDGQAIAIDGGMSRIVTN